MTPEEELEALRIRAAELETVALNMWAVEEDLEKALHVTKSMRSKVNALLPGARGFQAGRDTKAASKALKEKRGKQKNQ